MTGFILNSNDFREMQERGELPVKNILSPKQIQPNGLGMTLDKIFSFEGAGVMGEDRIMPEYKELNYDSEGFIELKQGSYKILFNEEVSIPDDCFALARPRSSLLRMGATISTALWDSGYVGRSEAMLNVMNVHGLKIAKSSRMIQLVFYKLGENVEETYNGKYQFENLNGDS